METFGDSVRTGVATVADGVRKGVGSVADRLAWPVRCVDDLVSCCSLVCCPNVIGFIILPSVRNPACGAVILPSCSSSFNAVVNAEFRSAIVSCRWGLSWMGIRSA